jgi:hypothetical protein
MRLTQFALLLFLLTPVLLRGEPPVPEREMVLVPFETAVVQGAGGAIWSSELRVRSSATTTVNLFPETCSWIGAEFPCHLRIDVAPGQTQLLDLASSSPAPSAIFLYVPLEQRDDIHFTLTVRNASSADVVGTTIPVVPLSRFVSQATIVGIPVGVGLRHTLRVYDSAFPSGSRFLVTVVDDTTNQPLVARQYETRLPVDPPSPPLSAATYDFSDILFGLASSVPKHVSVMIERSVPSPGWKFWPMVSVTDKNNRFAVFTPSR